MRVFLAIQVNFISTYVPVVIIYEKLSLQDLGTPFSLQLKWKIIVYNNNNNIKILLGTSLSKNQICILCTR